MENLKEYSPNDAERFLTLLRKVPLLPPQEVDRRLTRHGYRGQKDARRAACLMAYRHVARLRRLYLERRPRAKVMPKSNYLFVGPTGCGKTFLIELLFQRILKLPTVIVDVTSYSETGYVGQDTNSILTRLLRAANDNPLWASVGIVCLDEFDKLASGRNNAVFAGAGTTKDVTGLGVQRELLKLLEAADVVVPLELGHSSYGDFINMDTADVAFVASGAFSGLHEVVRQSQSEQSIGFGSDLGSDVEESFGMGFSQSQVDNIDHFYKYGFLPELIARFTRIVPFVSLAADTLKEILVHDVVDKMIDEFADEGLELSVEPSVLDYVVHSAIKRKTGARGLAALLTQHLEGAAFQSFGLGKSGRVTVRVEAGEIRVDGP
ncbi:MAG: AAA family ATPase [Deltaproteobacteria bacterium]|nr:AAA family ATPase [Deltaproteobacteria bacterium]